MRMPIVPAQVGALPEACVAIPVLPAVEALNSCPHRQGCSQLCYRGSCRSAAKASSMSAPVWSDQDLEPDLLIPPWHKRELSPVARMPRLAQVPYNARCAL